MKQIGGFIMSGLSMLTVLAILAGCLLSGVFGMQAVQAGSQFLWWTFDGDTFTTFEANAAIQIDTGSLDYTTGCPDSGVDDTLYAAADIYIMASGSVSPNVALTDISANGLPNTVVASTGGVFVNETIGYTGPTGRIGPGQYAVVFDECQDKVYDPGVDFLLDPAFEVIIPANVPPLPSIQAIKDQAVARSQYWSDAKFYYEAFFKLTEWIDKLNNAFYKDPLESLHKPFTVALDLYNKTASYVFKDPQDIAMTQLSNVVSHWQGIVADPPDPYFKQFSPLQNHPLIDLTSGNPVIYSTAQLSSEAGEESSLGEALLRSIERYQGAQLAHDGTWALVHARAIQRYAILLSAQIQQSSQAAAEANAALSADLNNVNQAATDFAAYQARVQTSGFNADELRHAQNLGISTAVLPEIRSVLLAANVSGFSKSSMLTNLQSLQNSSSAVSASLDTFAAAMEPVIQALIGDPGTNLLGPTADAGGPYSGIQGIPVNLTALGSISPSPIEEYTWDLNGDGIFNDAVGATPTYAFSQSFDGWIGLTVTNASGFSDIAYTRVSISIANHPPVISSFSPTYSSPSVIVGNQLFMQVLAADPDNDLTSVEWLVDGVVNAAGDTLNYIPSQEQVGLHLIQAVVNDSSQLRGTVIQRWIISVLLPDADGDQWNANTDCNDANPLVNPGTAEILGNGIDDDCNSATPDKGTAPRAFFNPVPQSGSFNAARWEYGATIDSVFNTSPSFNYNYSTLINDDDLSGAQFVSMRSGQWVKILLAGGQTLLIDRVKVTGHPFTDYPVRTFEIGVSTTSDDDAAFSTVLTAQAQRSADPQEFLLPEPVLAKYVRYRVIDSWSGVFIMTNRLQVMTGQITSGSTVNFNNLSSDPDSDIAAWTWNFGDGATSSEASPSHTYTTPGLYPVTLTVTDSQGNTNSFSLNQTIVDTADPDGHVMGLPDSRGTDFWLAFLKSSQEQGYLHLYISGDKATTGRVTIPRLFFTTEFQVTPGQITTVSLPIYLRLKGEHTAIGNLEDLGVHVTANDEVTVYGMNRSPQSTDAFTALPTDTLGTDYLVLAYVTGQTVCCGNGTEYAIVATQDNTTVTITSTAFSANDHIKPSDTYTLTMNRGEAYQLFGGNNWAVGNDVTGTSIHSDKPVAVFGGHSCAFVPYNITYCDHLVEQIPPVSTWGKEFVTVPLATRLRGDTFRILASEDNTSIQINGAAFASLNRGQFSETMFTQPSHITSDKPILVAQYSNGGSWDGVVSDPFMMLIPPYEQFLTRYTVMTPSSGFRANYINLAVSEDGVGAIQLDGSVIPFASFIAVPGSGFYVAQVQVQTGSHELASSYPFGIFMYGFDQDDSYGYPGGASLAQVARLSSLVLEPKTSNSSPGTQQCLVASVGDQNGKPLEGIRVDFAVTGTNMATGTAFSGADGRTQYCYTSSSSGQDQITASTGSLNDTAVVAWLNSNQPPTANGGVDQQVDEGATVSLDASGSSDPDGDNLSYQWSLISSSGPQVALSSQSDPQPTFTTSDNGTYTFRLTVTDSHGASASDEVLVQVDNIAPSATLNVPDSSQEGQNFLLSLSNPSDPSSSDLASGLHYSFDCGNGYGAFTTETSQECSADLPGNQMVKAQVKDKDGGVTEYSATVLVTKVYTPPIVSLGDDEVLVEGEHWQRAGSFTDQTGSVWTATVDYGDSTGPQPLSLNSDGTFVLDQTYADNGSYEVEVCVSNTVAAAGCAKVSITVANLAPVVEKISSSDLPVQIGVTIQASAAFTDPGILDTHSAIWDWGDGNNSAGTISASGGSGTATASHAYTTPGVYQVTLTITDKDNAQGQNTFSYIVIYDPQGGFVTGGGWITSPAGAYPSDPTLTGRANFGFVSKYQKGSNVPSGQTQFQFQAGDLNFHSTSYEWLVISGARAQFKGNGTINGSGNYGFLLTAVDGQLTGGDGTDKFRIKIWEISTGAIIYDNQSGDADDAGLRTALSGGSITIQNNK